MTVFIIIFIVIAAIFALALLGVVITDIVREMRKKKAEETKREAPFVEEAPLAETASAAAAVPVVVEDAVPEVMPEIVEHIDAEEADAMISDDLAMRSAGYERGAGSGQQGIINIGVIDDNFDAGAVITLQALKEKGLISQIVGRLKVLADGVLDKPLTVKAESYSIQAIKMIELTGGTVVILKD